MNEKISSLIAVLFLTLSCAAVGALAGSMAWLTAMGLRVTFGAPADPAWWPTVGTAALASIVTGGIGSLALVRGADAIPRIYALAGLIGGIATFHFTGAGAVAALLGGFVAHRLGRRFGRTLLDKATAR